MSLSNTFTLNVDFKKSTYLNEPIVTSNDEITFILNVFDDEQPFDLSNVTTVTLTSVRPDKQSVLTNGTKTGNQVTFNLGNTEVAVAGRVNAQVQMYDASGRVSTLPFTYKVLKDPVQDYVPSVDEQTLIELVLGDGPVILANAEQAITDLNNLNTTVTANEEARQSSELNRETSETMRVLNESDRQDAESARESAELTRTTDETIRQLNETDRQTAESTRQSTFNSKLTEIDTAITNAETATSNAQLVADTYVSKGVFNITTAYQKNNTVLDNGSTWRAKVDTQNNPLPVLPIEENDWWILEARKGVDGTGSVSTVNGQSPDVNGNVELTELKEVNRMTTTLQHGLNVINSDQASPLKVEFYGRTLANLLGKDGNFEDLTRWNGIGNIATLDTSIKKYGNSSIKFNPNGTSSYVYMDDVKLEASKYYVLILEAYIQSYVDGQIPRIQISDSGGYTNNSGITFDNTKINQWQTKVYKLSGRSNTRLTIGNTSVSNCIWNVDGVRLVEVSKETYDKIGVSLTDADVERMFPYVDSVQHVKNPVMKVEGENLLPPFTEWTLSSNVRVISPYELELNATTTNHAIEINVPALTNQQYTFIGEGNYLVTSRASDGSWLQDHIVNASQGTFTSHSNAKMIRIVTRNNTAGIFIFKNPMLTLGTTPKPFVPRNPSYLYAECVLAGDNNKKDILYKEESTNVWKKVKYWENDETLTITSNSATLSKNASANSVIIVDDSTGEIYNRVTTLSGTGKEFTQSGTGNKTITFNADSIPTSPVATYQLATSIVEEITTKVEGDLSIQGDAQVEVTSGFTYTTDSEGKRTYTLTPENQRYSETCNLTEVEVTYATNIASVVSDLVPKVSDNTSKLSTHDFALDYIEAQAMNNALDLDNHELLDASTTQKGHVQLNDTLTSTSTTQALTANQGKVLDDKITVLTQDVGDKNALNTVDKTSVVDGINEVNNNLITLQTQVDKKTMVSVTDFGAIGDGVSDDTQAIQDAINSIQGKGTVFFPTGNYKVTRTILLKSSVSMVGEGTFSTQIQTDVQNLTIFSLVFDIPTGAHLSIEDLAIRSLNTGVKGLQATYCNRLHLKNISFYGCEINAEFDRGGLNRIDGCISSGTATLKSGQLKLWSSVDTEFGCVFTSINDYRIENNGNGVQSPAILFRRAVGVRCNGIITNDSDYTGICLQFENDCQGITIENSIIVGYGIGAKFLRGTGVSNAPVFCTLSNVDFDQCSQNSILVEDGNWLHFDGGHITSSQVAKSSKAIAILNSTTQWIRITNVQIGGYPDTGGTGILINGTNYVSVTDCLIDECNQGIALIGINTNLQIKNNTLVRVDYPLVGDPSGATNIIMNNKGISGSSKVSTPTLPASDTEITNSYSYPVRIYIYGGNVSLIRINGQGAGFTGGFVFLMPGETLKITYTTAPNWNWIGI